jgi:uroporphyrinogen III methyltransferase/synthase
VLLLRASRGREVLAERLAAGGVEVHQAVVYESRDVENADAEVMASIREGTVDWVTVTSSAIARSLVKLFGDDLKRTKLAAISPLTAEALRDAGHDAAAIATEYTTAGLVDAILKAERGASGNTPCRRAWPIYK